MDASKTGNELGENQTVSKKEKRRKRKSDIKKICVLIVAMGFANIFSSHDSSLPKIAESPLYSQEETDTATTQNARVTQGGKVSVILDLAFNLLIVISGVVFVVISTQELISKEKTPKAKLFSRESWISLYPKKSLGTVEFTVKNKCTACESNQMRVSTPKYRRLAVSYSSHADWKLCCPWCGNSKRIKYTEAKKLALENGQYVVYKHAELSDGWLAAFIISFMLLFAATFLLAFVSRTDTPVYATEIQSAELKTGKQFVGEDLELIDVFGIRFLDNWSGDWQDTEAIQELHILARFETEYGKFLLPIKVLPEKPFFQDCISWLATPQELPPHTSIRGYIGKLANTEKSMLNETVQKNHTYYPEYDEIIGNAEVLYWDSEATPSCFADNDPLSYLIFRTTIQVAGVASVLFFCLDRYENSDKKSEKVQERYNRKHKR